MKIIYKIKLHPLFYVVTVIAILTGHFHDFFTFLLIIIFHELGHILSGLYFRWRIKQINILPFGALTIFDEGLTKPLKEEFVIAISGSIFQIIFYLLVRNDNMELIHYSLLLFNLLPITPLDGSKIVNILLNTIFPFKKSYWLTIIISIILIILLCGLSIGYGFHLLFFLIMLFLGIKVMEDIKNRNYTMHKFLYERYFFPRKYIKNKIIKGENFYKMYKERYHLFKVKNICYTEHEILRKRFDFKGKL